MPRSTDVFEEIVRLRDAGRAAAMCTVIQTRGSTPGKETMRMLVRDDFSTIGSVGGGCVEADVIEVAKKVLQTGLTETHSFTLNKIDSPESGLICGGQLTVLIEAVVQPTIVVFGGGHVASSITRIATEAGFQVRVLDDRPEFANHETHPQAASTSSGSWAELIDQLRPVDNLFLVIATRGHKADHEVLVALNELKTLPRYLGLLGSKAKKSQLVKMLADAGVEEDFIRNIRTPIGLSIGSRTAGEIGVSLVAELIKIKNLGDCLHEIAPRPPRYSRRHVEFFRQGLRLAGNFSYSWRGIWQRAISLGRGA